MIWPQMFATKSWKARLDFRDAASFGFDRRHFGKKRVGRLLTYTSNAGRSAAVNAG